MKKITAICCNYSLLSKCKTKSNIIENQYEYTETKKTLSFENVFFVVQTFFMSARVGQTPHHASLFYRSAYYRVRAYESMVAQEEAACPLTEYKKLQTKSNFLLTS